MVDNHLAQILTPITPGGGVKVWLDIGWRDATIESISFTNEVNPKATEPLPKAWQRAFDRYWGGPPEKDKPTPLAHLPLTLVGTPYQQKVWRLLQQIPAGETASYGQLSSQIDSSPRAVAAACRANPVVLAVPCHRVVAKEGIGGFMGATVGEAIDIKRWLITHEQQ